MTRKLTCDFQINSLQCDFIDSYEDDYIVHWRHQLCKVQNHEQQANTSKALPIYVTLSRAWLIGLIEIGTLDYLFTDDLDLNRSPQDRVAKTGYK